MSDSPYSPPKSALLDLPKGETGPSLPDLSGYSNEQLRELLCSPDLYTPESVHMAARELASRHAIPRYYTRMRSRFHRSPVRVHRSHEMDLSTKLRILFSESNLKVYCLVIALLRFVVLAFQVITLARILKLAGPEYYAKNLQYLLSSGFSILAATFVVLFFFTLYRTLSIRAVPSN